MSQDWSNVKYTFQKEEKIEESSAAAKPVTATGNILPVTITTVDGRKVPAMAHLGSRSVYPKLK